MLAGLPLLVAATLAVEALGKALAEALYSGGNLGISPGERDPALRARLAGLRVAARDAPAQAASSGLSFLRASLSPTRRSTSSASAR